MPKIGAYFSDEVWSVILEAHNIKQYNSEEDYGLRKILIHTYRDSTVNYVNELLKKNAF